MDLWSIAPAYLKRRIMEKYAKYGPKEFTIFFLSYKNLNIGFKGLYPQEVDRNEALRALLNPPTADKLLKGYFF
jgi:hypothetical protein